MAELAQGFTFRIECGGRGTPPAAAPSAPVEAARVMRVGPVLACQGPVSAWNDCFGGVDLPDGANMSENSRTGNIMVREPICFPMAVGMWVN